MKKVYLKRVKGVWLALVSAGLLSSPVVWAQLIPGIQWSKPGKTLTITTDGNIATSNGGGVVKYALNGDKLLETSGLQGSTFLGVGKGPTVNGYAPIADVFRTASTTDGGVVLLGKETGSNATVLTRIDSSFRQQGGATATAGDYVIGTPDGGQLTLANVAEYNNVTQKFTGRNVVSIVKTGPQTSWTRTLFFSGANSPVPDSSLTKANAVINAPEGGFLVVGYYNSRPHRGEIDYFLGEIDPLLNSNSRGWIAKLDNQGNLLWQRILVDLPMNNFFASAPRVMVSITDVTAANDGAGYALVGVGYEFYRVVPPPPSLSLLEINIDGSFKRSKRFYRTRETPYITSYTRNNLKHYVIGHTSRQDRADPEILVINPAILSHFDPNLFTIISRRTFGSSTDVFLKGIAAAGDSSLVFISSNNQITKLRNQNDGGGDNCNFAQPQRVGTWNSLEVQIRQYGDKRVLVTFLSSDKHYPRGDNFWEVFTKDAEVEGLRACLNGGITNFGGFDAPANLPTPPGYSTGREADGAFFFERSRTQPPVGSLALLAPTYNCQTGAFRFNTTGGDGSGIEFMAIGITGWSTNPDQFVDRESRTVDDVQPFTLMARQSGQVVSYVWNLKAACGRARMGVTEPNAELQVKMLGNPVNDAVTVEIRGGEGQPLTLRLLDLRGHLIESRTVEQARETERQRFELAQQRPGLLLLRASSGSRTRTVKILKQ